MNRNCEIVKDLLPSYIEGILSEETKKFVEEHINNCPKCKLMLEKMKKNEINNKIDPNDQIEIDHLKKYRRKMKSLKIALFVIILLVILFIFLFVIQYKNNANVISKVSVNIEKLKELDNYSIMSVEHRIDYENMCEETFSNKVYYIDGKYKEEKHAESSNQIINNANEYYYGEINSNKQTQVSEETKTIYNVTSNYTYAKKGEFFNILYDNTGIFGKDLGLYTEVILKTGYQLRTDRYNGKQCYVLKIQDKSGYTEYWIEKENNIPIRIIQDIYDRYYSEKTYSINIGNVKEEDVTLPPLDGYKIENIEKNLSSESLEAYNIIKND